LQNAPESKPLRRVLISGLVLEELAIADLSFEIIDRVNRPKTIRIVSLAPNVTSILLALGAGRHLVGVSRWCKDVASVGRRRAVGDCWQLDVAEVMKLKPTLLIGSVPFAPETVAKILAEPVAFLAINPRTLMDIENDIRLLGGLVNRAVAAEHLIARMRSGFAAVRRRAAGARDAERPKVYCEAWPSPRISSPPWVNDLVRLAGGTIVVPTGQRVTDQQVAEANPDVMILAWAAVGNRAKPASALRNPAWKDVSAVKHKRVFAIRDELLNTPGPPLVGGAQALRAIFRSLASAGRATEKQTRKSNVHRDHPHKC
jgi:iron complex transport system substrate-binding protein